MPALIDTRVIILGCIVYNVSIHIQSIQRTPAPPPPPPNGMRCALIIYTRNPLQGVHQSFNLGAHIGPLNIEHPGV